MRRALMLVSIAQVSLLPRAIALTTKKWQAISRLHLRAHQPPRPSRAIRGLMLAMERNPKLIAPRRSSIWFRLMLR